MPAALLLAAASAHAEQGRILIALAVVLVGAKLFGALVELERDGEIDPRAGRA